MAQIGKLAGMLAGKNGGMKAEQGKSVTAPPPPTPAVKPHVDEKVTEKFSPF